MTSTAETLRDRLVLVKIRISSWTGKIASDKAARSAESAHSAKAGEVDAKIHQVSKKYTGPIEVLTRGLYRWFHAATLPWSDGGWRVMDVGEYMKAADHVRGIQDEISAAARDVFGRPEIYDEIKRDSAKRLAGLYEETAFPTAEELISKYGARLTRDVVTNTDDIRMSGMTDEDLDKFKKGIEGDLTSNLNGALSALIARLRETVSEFVEKVEDTIRTGKNARFGKVYHSIAEECKALHKLNLTADRKITAAIEQVEKTLLGCDLDGLNHDAGTRGFAASLGKNILEDIDAIMAEGGE